MMRIGIQFQPHLAPRQVIEVAKRADDLGYEMFALTDTSFGNDPFAVLAAMAIQTRQIKLATDIAVMLSRHPVNLASVARTIDDLSDGRMLLGIGTSHREMMEDGLGIPFRKPFSAMKEAHQVLRGLLDGERVDFQGEFFRVQGALQPAPRRRIPVYIGAVQPRMLNFSGAVADGALINHVPLRYAGTVVGAIRQGAIEVGRRPNEVKIALSVPTYVTTSAAETQRARELRKESLGHNLRLTIYRRRYQDLGFETEVEAVLAAFDRGESPVPQITDEMVKQVVNAGSVEECQAVIHQYEAAGIDHLLLTPYGPPGDIAPIHRTIEALAPR